ncbi:UNVERIFIED_CONTAM: hypothetical protein HDU68_010583, partial [Siphonaria sp. JEL0065]
MGPKKGGKKGKKSDDFDAELDVAFDDSAPDTPIVPVAAKETDGFDELNKDEEGNDLGGLMSLVSKMKKGGKKGKGKKKADDDEEDAAAISAKLEALDAADAARESVSVKKDNKKKGKGKKKSNDSDEEDAAAIIERLDAEDAAGTSPAVAASVPKKEVKKAAAPLDEDEPVTIVKSKKEKEKERKERQKAAEKAKKAEAAAIVQAAVAATPKNDEDAGGDDDDEEDGGDAAGGASNAKNKKKKKKKAGAAVEEPAPAATPAKKKGGAIAALQQMMAAKKAAEEEAARIEAEERRKIEEEEARLAAIEREKEEAKAKKKEKERLKKEELKKAGKYMTPAQKAAANAAAARLQAMLAQGLKVEALERGGGAAAEEKKPKRVVYGKKKKPTTAGGAAASKEEESPNEKEDAEAEAAEAAALAAKEAEEAEEARIQAEASERARVALALAEPKPVADAWDEEEAEVKDDWDASSEDDAKDNWDDDSADEQAKLAPPKKEAAKLAAAPVPAPAPVMAATVAPGKNAAPGKTAAGAPLSAPAKAAAVTAAAGPTKALASPQKVKSVATPAKKDESEDDDDEDSEDDDDSDDSDEDSDEDSDDDSDEESEDEGPKMSATKKQELLRKLEQAKKKEAAHQAAVKARSKDDLRSPICVILGHVDTGKTKVLDKIRQTNVQEGEAGGITQQIGATFFPMEAIRQKTAELHKDAVPDYKLPGLLIIDTPGHESFTNLRSRGSSLCNIAVLVVDIMHGLEPQTIESLGLLKARKTPFIVALNKIDRIYGWKAIPNCPVQDTLAQQSDHVIAEFNERVEKTKLAFAEQGLNSEVYYKNKNVAKYVSLVPTSAVTGEGIPDLLHLLVDLTQNRLTDSLMYLSELSCTVLEVKVIEGLGTTIDVILSNGVLREGDKIIVCGLNGPIVTNVRALLTPEPMRELRIKSAYVHHKEVKASLGVKISAPGLEKAIAGSRLIVIGEDEDEEDYYEEIMSDFSALNEKFITPGRGVCVQASTLGSLEALLTFLKASNIPVSGYNLGPVHKKDVIRTTIMLERHRELAMLLAFDVTIDKDAEEMAEQNGIKIFKADIIYHLFDQFTAHMKNIEEMKRRDQAPMAVFPCVLRIIPGMVFNKRSPIIMGVDVVEGVLKIGTPICVVDENKHITSLGKCTGIELNKKVIQEVKKGGPSVSIKLEVPGYDTPKMFGRHFTQDQELYSHITRASIDILKTTFRADLSMDDWKTVKRIKTILNQSDHVIAEFNERVEKTKLAFAEQGLNSEVYYKNKNVAKYVSLVPTSAVTGEGIPDLLHLLVDLTQNRLTDSLMYLSELSCTVLEVKVIEGLGTTIDVILSNGVLREGDKIIVCGLNGPIVTNVRALLTPEPMRELRIKSAYVHHKEVKASLGVKISAPGLEKAIAGSRLIVIGEDEDEEDYYEEIMSDFSALNEKFITPGRGVCVQASTLGSLEALLTFLKASNIPVSGYNLGPVHKKDVIRTTIMLERHRELAMLLAFDVAIDKDAEEMAEQNGIKIFKADIIYHLFDQFTAHMKNIEEMKRRDQAPMAVFPCVLRIIPGMVFNKRSPIIMGVDVVEGVLKIGTPICVVDENKHITSLGKCTGIELNKKVIQEVKKGGPSVSIKLEVPGYDTPKMFGRHFTQDQELYSHITRASIDILKTTFRADLSMDDWKTVKRIKTILN